MKPYLCLLPGLDGTGLLFKPLLESLDGRCEFLIIRHSRANNFLELVEEIEDQLPKNRKISLIAESFTGPVAIEIIARKNFDIGASVLCATFCTSPFLQLVSLAEFLPNFAFQFTALKKLALNIFGMDSNTESRVKLDVHQIIESEDPYLIKKRLHILKSIDVTDQVRNVLVPILYIRASRDRVISNQLGQRMIDGLPYVEVTEVSGPHLILQSEPGVCAALIMEHVTTNQGVKP
jgi:pimeloyl-[acyl-carrier protein] methyl ester esterase